MHYSWDDSAADSMSNSSHKSYNRQERQDRYERQDRQERRTYSKTFTSRNSNNFQRFPTRRNQNNYQSTNDGHIIMIPSKFVGRVIGKNSSSNITC